MIRSKIKTLVTKMEQKIKPLISSTSNISRTLSIVKTQESPFEETKRKIDNIQTECSKKL